jgi:hypothetical protein
MTLATIALVWLALIVLFCIGNKRWHDRMARMDADMEQSMQHMQQPAANDRAGRKWA